MDLDLKAFSLTLAAGLALASAGVGILYVFRDDFVKKHATELKSGFGVSAILLAVCLLSFGIMVENLSKNALAGREPSLLATQMLAVLPTQIAGRAAPLIAVPTRWDASVDKERPPRFANTEAVNHALTSCLQKVDDQTAEHRGKRFAPGGAQVVFRFLDPGERVALLLADLANNGLATQNERLRYSEIVFHEASSANDSGLFRLDCKDLIGSAANLYYLAKNRVFLESGYMDELATIEQRVVFSRSIAFVALGGIYLLAFSYLASTAGNLLDDYGGIRTIVALILALFLVYSAFDLLVSLPDGKPAFLLDELIRPEHRSLRIWSLPALMVFFLLYRTRRFWGRLFRQIRETAQSGLRRSSLLVTLREREARRCLLVAALMAMAFQSSKWAYVIQEAEYSGRVFGYYLTLRESELANELNDRRKKPSP